MKWYRHLTTSLDDPDIQAAMDQYRADGYLVFFGLLEIIARETKESFTPVSLKLNYCTRKLRLRADKFKKILKFFEKKGRFMVQYEGDEIQLFCPKLKEMADNWTSRKAGKTTEQLPSKAAAANEQLTIDTDTDTETDIKIDRAVEIVENFKKALKSKKGLSIKDEHLTYLYKLLETYDPKVLFIAWKYIFLNDEGQEKYGYTLANFYKRIEAIYPDAVRRLRAWEREQESKSKSISIAELMKQIQTPK